MSDNPLTKLARLAGGAAMLTGPLGYQVLGQMLIARSTETELAGANVVLAAVSRQTNAAVQIAVRLMVPALLVEVLSRKEQQRLKRLSSELEHLLRDLENRAAEVRGKPGWMIMARQKHKTPLSLDEALFKELLMLRCQGGKPERRVKALEYLLGRYDPVPVDDGDWPRCAAVEDLSMQKGNRRDRGCEEIRHGQLAKRNLQEILHVIKVITRKVLAMVRGADQQQQHRGFRSGDKVKK